MISFYESQNVGKVEVGFCLGLITYNVRLLGPNTMLGKALEVSEPFGMPFESFPRPWVFKTRGKSHAVGGALRGGSPVLERNADSWASAVVRVRV